jgi:hypothetical protein
VVDIRMPLHPCELRPKQKLGQDNRARDSSVPRDHPASISSRCAGVESIATSAPRLTALRGAPCGLLAPLGRLPNSSGRVDMHEV